jgi:hypothetical protein
VAASSAENKIRIVLEGLCGETASLNCRKERINQTSHFSRLQQFLVKSASRLATQCKQVIGVDTRTIKEANGKPFCQEIYDAWITACS